MHKTTNAQYNTPQPQLGKPQKKNRELRNRFTKYENHDINSINRNTPQSKKMRDEVIRLTKYLR